jgi:hypothetical protein
MVGLNERLDGVTAEGEANIVEGAFKTVNARLVLHPQTPFRAFPVQVVIAVHHFFYLVCVSRITSFSEACIRPPTYVSPVLSEVTFPLLSCYSALSRRPVGKDRTNNMERTVCQW